MWAFIQKLQRVCCAYLHELECYLSCLCFFTQPGTAGSAFSMSAPITKVVKNDAYTAPRPAVPVASPRPTTSLAATRSSAAALQPVSRTLQQSTAETSATAPPPPPQVNPFIFICSSVCVLSNCAHITCVIMVFIIIIGLLA